MKQRGGATSQDFYRIFDQKSGKEYDDSKILKQYVKNQRGLTRVCQKSMSLFMRAFVKYMSRIYIIIF